MNCLADTHVLIWALRDDPQLSTKAREILLDADNTIFCSIISIWEIAIKYSLHKEDFLFSPEMFFELCIKSGYKLLDLEVDHIFTMGTLKRSETAPRHRDPFDRLLLGQAKAGSMKFLSHDSLLEGYNEPCLINI